MFTYIVVKMGFIIGEIKYVSNDIIFFTPNHAWDFQSKEEVEWIKEAVKDSVFNDSILMCKPRLAHHTRMQLRARNAVLVGTSYEDVTIWRARH